MASRCAGRGGGEGDIESRLCSEVAGSHHFHADPKTIGTMVKHVMRSLHN